MMTSGCYLMLLYFAVTESYYEHSMSVELHSHTLLNLYIHQLRIKKKSWISH